MKLKSLIAFFVLILIHSLAIGATYYVDYGDGNDGDSGLCATDEGACGPFKRIPGDDYATGTAASTTPSAGDTICVQGGETYYGQGGQIDIKSSGTSGSRITYDGSCSGYGTGKAIMSGGGFNPNNKSYTTIQNFSFIDLQQAAVEQDPWVDGAVMTGVWVLNNDIDGSGDTPSLGKGAIYLDQVHAFKINNNTITDINYKQSGCCQVGTFPCPDGQDAAGQRGAGIMVHGVGSGGVFSTYSEGSEIKDNTVNRTCDSSYIIFGQQNVTISGNISYGLIWRQHSQPMTYYQNGLNGIIKGNFLQAEHSYGLTTEGNDVGSSPGLVISNNIIDIKNGATYVLAEWDVGSSSGTMRVINNTLLRSDNQAWTDGGNTSMTFYFYNNIIDGTTGNYSCSTRTEGCGGATICETDLSAIFVDTTFDDIDDYKMITTSPCKDQGTDMSAYVTDDYWEGSRPYNSVYDMGAHEFGSGAPSQKISGAKISKLRIDND